MAKSAKSPNDSTQLSTHLPSTSFSKDRYSIDGSSLLFSGESRRQGNSRQMGSSPSYLQDHLQRMHKDIEITTGALEREQRRLYKINTDLVAAETEYAGKRQKYRLFQCSQDDGVNASSRNVRDIERHLEKAIADLNKGAADNERLREQINQLRKERKILNVVFKKLERGIHRTGKQLGDLMSDIQNDAQIAEEAMQRSDALNKMLDKERTAFLREIEDVKKTISEQMLVRRQQDRIEEQPRKSLVTGLSRAKRVGKSYMIADEEDAFSESDMYRRIFRLSFLNTIQRRHIKQHQKNIEVFEQAFATIKSSTGISDIEEIVKIFIALEQRNFSLLTYVNQLNREIESIEIRNKELQKQLNDHKQSESQSENKRFLALSAVSAQIAQTRVATREKNAVIEENTVVLQEVQPMIWNVVKYLKASMPALVRASYEEDAPPMKVSPPDDHDENLINHLMYIEENLMIFKMALSPEPQRHLPGPSRAVVVERPRDLPVAHTQGDDTDDDETGGLSERMYSRAELRERAQVSNQKRRKKPAPAGRHGETGRIDTSEDTPPASEPVMVTPAKRDAQSHGSKELCSDSHGGKSPSIKDPVLIEEDDVRLFKEPRVKKK